MKEQLNHEYECTLGIKQGECLLPFLFAMHLKNLEKKFLNSKIEVIDVDMFLYADDIIMLLGSKEELQAGLNMLSDYCYNWKLTVNT